MSTKKIFYWCPICKKLHSYLEVEIGCAFDSPDVERWKIENNKALLLEGPAYLAYNCSQPYVLIRCPAGAELFYDSGWGLDDIEEIIREIINPKMTVAVDIATGEITLSKRVQEILTKDEVKKLLAGLV
jgi:hypothetical protein